MAVIKDHEQEKVREKKRGDTGGSGGKGGKKGRIGPPRAGVSGHRKRWTRIGKRSEGAGKMGEKGS